MKQRRSGRSTAIQDKVLFCAFAPRPPGRTGKRRYVVAIGASPIGRLACVDACVEDFREDSPRNDVPTIIIHGDDDRILPANATSRRQAKMIKDVKYVEIKGGSHGITWTRAEEIKAEVVKFLA